MKENTSVHSFYCGDSTKLSCIETSSVDLIVTSPPYPMVTMWDEMFGSVCKDISSWLQEGKVSVVFDSMHQYLNKVWNECIRVLKEGGFLCINIGDAVRTINGEFQLFPNHSRIIEYCTQAGLTYLPSILWRKPNNSPTKFMGSGMYPSGAYVTYEHEYILVFRKGKKRVFSKEEQKRRRESAIFWEERNQWFSDLWNLNGCRQNEVLLTSRKRNASFPFVLPYRLISMYSIQGDTVLDPFMGLGTTTMASMALHRNSIGVDIKSDVVQGAITNVKRSIPFLLSCFIERINNHLDFISNLPEEKKRKLFVNEFHKMGVVSKQEIKAVVPLLDKVMYTNNQFLCNYEPVG